MKLRTIFLADVSRAFPRGEGNTRESMAQPIVNPQGTGNIKGGFLKITSILLTRFDQVILVCF